MGEASSDRELSHPDLYAGDGDSAVLLGTHCEVCGYVAFPRQHYGCEKCGATGVSLRDVRLPSQGRLTSFATVHMHQAKNIAAPFVIGEVELDSGPTLRVTMVEPTDEALRVGARVTGRLFPAPTPGPDGAGKLELRFRQVAA